MFTRSLFHVCFSIVILPCMTLVGLVSCGDDDEGSTPPRERIVFLSSGLYTIDELDSLAVADSRCQAQAENGSLPGTYKAWLSDSFNSPDTRFTKGGSFKLVDGSKVADDWRDLTDGTIQSPINMGAFGGQGSVAVWTGTYTDGRTGENPELNWLEDNCGDWQCIDNVTCDFEKWAIVGQSNARDSDWTYYDRVACTGDRVYAIYCFQQ